MNNEIICGLDISTSTVGVSIASYIDGRLNIMEITHLKFKTSSKVNGTSALFFKSKQFAEFIKKYKDYGITKVVIEAPLMGSNNVKTVATLLLFNGMLSQQIFDVLGIEPAYISSYDARKFAFPELMRVRKYNKKGEIYAATKIQSSLKKNEVVLFGDFPWDIEKKVVLQGKIANKFPDINWVYDKKGDLKKENFDASDSLVCILGYINQQTYGETAEPTIVDWEKTGDTSFAYTVSFCDKTYNCQISL